MDPITTISEVLKISIGQDLRDHSNGGSYILLQASYIKMNKDKKIGINEAERFYLAFPIFCIISLLEN
jgi:hypothetical protein